MLAPFSFKVFTLSSALALAFAAGGVARGIWPFVWPLAYSLGGSGSSAKIECIVHKAGIRQVSLYMEINCISVSKSVGLAFLLI